MVLHQGVSGGGHYTAEVLIGESWHRFNDDHVDQYDGPGQKRWKAVEAVDGGKVVALAPHLLFYKRLDKSAVVTTPTSSSHHKATPPPLPPSSTPDLIVSNLSKISPDIPPFIATPALKAKVCVSGLRTLPHISKTSGAEDLCSLHFLS